MWDERVTDDHVYEFEQIKQDFKDELYPQPNYNKFYQRPAAEKRAGAGFLKRRRKFKKNQNLIKRKGRPFRGGKKLKKKRGSPLYIPNIDF